MRKLERLRYISLPAVNMKVSLSAYCGAVRLAKANPEQEFKHGFTTWWPTMGREIVRQFREGLHDRINIRGGEAVSLGCKD